MQMYLLPFNLSTKPSMALLHSLSFFSPKTATEHGSTAQISVLHNRIYGTWSRVAQCANFINMSCKKKNHPQCVNIVLNKYMYNVYQQKYHESIGLLIK